MAQRNVPLFGNTSNAVRVADVWRTKMNAVFTPQPVTKVTVRTS